MGELSEARRCWKAETIRANNLDVENGELKYHIQELEDAFNEIKSIFGKESKHPDKAMNMMVNIAIKMVPPKH